MDNDPHVSLSHGADLLHVVGDLASLGRHRAQRGSAPPPALLHRPGPAHCPNQPHLDTQEDHAASHTSRLELQGRTKP